MVASRVSSDPFSCPNVYFKRKALAACRPRPCGISRSRSAHMTEQPNSRADRRFGLNHPISKIALSWLGKAVKERIQRHTTTSEKSQGPCLLLVYQCQRGNSARGGVPLLIPVLESRGSKYPWISFPVFAYTDSAPPIGATEQVPAKRQPGCELQVSTRRLTPQFVKLSAPGAIHQLNQTVFEDVVLTSDLAARAHVR
jgi:hypothetical protein